VGDSRRSNRNGGEGSWWNAGTVLLFHSPFYTGGGKMLKIIKKHKVLSGFAIFIFLIAGACVITKPIFVHSSNVLYRLYGAPVVTAINVPYKYRGFAFFKGYSILFASYKPLPKIDVEGLDIETIFLSLCDAKYSAHQEDPTRIFIDGGNCQAYSVYLCTALRKMGIECGYRPRRDHIYAGAVIDGVGYKLDAVTEEFEVLSKKDVEYLRSVIGDRYWMN
jgi:hypothetical protein